MAAEGVGKGFDSLPDPLLEQGEEDIFLAFEVGIKSAAGVSGAGRDVFQAGAFKTVLGENALGGVQQFPPGGPGALGLAHAGRGGKGGSLPAGLAARGDGRWLHRFRPVCLTGYIRVCILLGCVRPSKP